MHASDLMVMSLEAEGIEYIFGIPGEENADFMMSLEKSDQIKFLLYGLCLTWCNSHQFGISTK